MASKVYLLQVLLVQLVGLYWYVESVRPEYVYLNATSPYYLFQSSKDVGKMMDMEKSFFAPLYGKLEIICSVSLPKGKDCSGGNLTIKGLYQNEVSLCNVIPHYKRQARLDHIVVKFKMPQNAQGRFKCLVQLDPKRKGVLPEDLQQLSLEYQKKVDYPADKLSCDCGKNKNNKKKRIVGGKNTEPHEYPFMAYIKSQLSEKQYFICGGSIITNQHILTAAHCLMNRNVERKVFLGAHNVKEDKDMLVLGVQSIHKPGPLDQVTAFNDIALLVLTETIQFNDNISPVCLPTEKHEHGVLTALGWGRVGVDLGSSDTLRSGELTATEMKRCVEYYFKNKPLPSNGEFMICTFSPIGDVLKGDSGGPLVYLDTELNRWIQVGLMSANARMNTGEAAPAVLTSVLYHYDWIQSVIRMRELVLEVAKTYSSKSTMKTGNPSGAAESSSMSKEKGGDKYPAVRAALEKNYQKNQNVPTSTCEKIEIFV